MSSSNGHLQVTDASSWLPQKQLLKLKSTGRVVEVKPISAIDLILRDGSVPESLAQVFTQSLVAKQQQAWTPKQEDLPKLAELIDKIVLGSVVTPTVVADRAAVPEHGEIHISWLKDSEKMDLMDWAMDGGGQRESLENFSQGQGSSVPASRNGKRIRDKAK